MSSYYNFKKIQVIPGSEDLLNIILSKIQRKTPTVIHPGYKISRIREFYMRKIKFAQDCFDEKLDHITGEFPKLDEIHPFYADLMNVLYDRDHYKLALGQISKAKHLIDSVAKDYTRLVKFGDSLYRCKQLKVAALGRMATIIKRQKDSLTYLEQVRQHLARLPSIDPNTRTLLVCGYPNVGKSSFMNKLTRADVDVQPYAFTTKSLFVGHMDYKYLRWQLIDTPGILDHPLEDRNTIEMQSVTALAHLRACVLFFIDLSEECGFSIDAQLNLYNTIKPLFAGKPTVMVVNKIDKKRMEDLDAPTRERIEAMLARDGVTLAQQSCYTDEGVIAVRDTACDLLIAARADMKLRSHRVQDVLNKLHVAQPQARDDVARPAFVPEAALERQRAAKEMVRDPDTGELVPLKRSMTLARDVEAEHGGAGVYNVNLKDRYLLANDDWKQDIIPELMDGKNIADFIDPDIAERLAALEEEEERLIAEGFYDDNTPDLTPAELETRARAKIIRDKKALARAAHSSLATMPRMELHGRLDPRPERITRRLNTLPILARRLAAKGKDLPATAQLMRSVSQGGWRAAAEDPAYARKPSEVMKMRRLEGDQKNRQLMGLAPGKAQYNQAIKEVRFTQRGPNLMAKRGESDRHIMTKMPKHLFSGKRTIGKTDRR
ncbi:hypothetical protein CXG81DRAFT_11383 [Caulochytrium protostelioides]|uniref:Nucleolar GTP-binding protein 1 n=1 Tax=Caulochytrium protostelioides TaxID=1555241 RepID=A0A4P9WXQ4_9FUNG|nr:P-loop containing nucleoside triphosphate hydrolase protein [Caulochytrium protostelioides]RKP01909.1 hypothetical protein CXG81DRAFT_11383 [Caulochytrium protostelioides]|eukprot:RKP01909.1 hypothetical protein CXG81DRAFT_11383 [Caulochytrium protostelioides]